MATKKKKRRTHSPEFKARIAIEAIRGIKTVSEIAAEHGVHPVQVTQWKGQLAENSAGVFEKPASARSAEAEVEKEMSVLERKVGQLTMAKDFLEKSARSWGYGTA